MFPEPSVAGAALDTQAGGVSWQQWRSSLIHNQIVTKGRWVSTIFTASGIEVFQGANRREYPSPGATAESQLFYLSGERFVGSFRRVPAAGQDN